MQEKLKPNYVFEIQMQIRLQNLKTNKVPIHKSQIVKQAYIEESA
jgi:hypothetical protein